MWQLLGSALRYRRVPSKGFKQLTGKYGNKNYYKGKGVKSTGHHTKLGACAAMAFPACPASRRPACQTCDTATWEVQASTK